MIGSQEDQSNTNPMLKLEIAFDRLNFVDRKMESFTGRFSIGMSQRTCTFYNYRAVWISNLRSVPFESLE